MNARRRLWTAVGLSAAGLLLAFGYLQRRLNSSAAEILQEPPATAELPPDSRPNPLLRLEASQTPQTYTNEELHAFLEQDQKRLGIKKIYMKGEPGGELTRPRLNPKQVEEAKNRIRAMAEELRRANEARKKQAVVLDGDKPSLLSKPEDAYAAQGLPTSPESTPSILPEDSSGMRQHAGPIQDQERVLKSQAELDRFWDEMKSSRPKPKVDFDRQMVVAVIADPDLGMGVLIVRVLPSRHKLTVEYKDSSPGEDGAYYESRIIDKTDAPIAFRKLVALHP